MAETDRAVIGAMSGTSADGVDVALVQIAGKGTEMTARLRAHHHRPYDPILRSAILDLRASGAAALPRIAWIVREVSVSHAAAINELFLLADIGPSDVAAVAAHGQTVFHDPPDTVQLFDPALVAQETGCRVISDFRRADCAAGGQGAPLVPFADYCLFRCGERGRAMVNIGGIANLTFLPAGAGLERVIAFDTGPGNCISDYLARTHDPAGAGVDVGGKIAAGGAALHPLAQRMAASPFFSQPPPRSTDGTAMIKQFCDCAAELGRRFSPENLLATACLVTAESIYQAMRQFLSPFPDEVIVSGGGAKNETIMSLLKQKLGSVPLLTSDDLGMPVAAKEAVAFALLGAATLDGVPANVPTATGARRPVVLGSITPRP